MMYYSHNLHFIAMCASMSGNYPESKKAAAMLSSHVSPLVKDMPPLEGFVTIPMAVDVRFQKWPQVLSTPQPDPSMKVANVFWHFARGMALAGTGKISEAQAEQQIVHQAAEQTPPDAIFAPPVGNRAKDVLTIAANVLSAKIAIAKHDNQGAIGSLRDAVAIQDTLKYNEPPDWFYPVRESLGAVLLQNGNAAEAEKVFREDLERNPRNPRSLFGLSEALKAQKRDYDAQFVQKQLDAAWKGPEKLKLQDLT
jgi:tetratricopeptide (TPR) repeat protein